jgi:hypothetical protein
MIVPAQALVGNRFDVNFQLQLLLSVDFETSATISHHQPPSASKRSSRVQTHQLGSVCFGAFNA